MQKPSNTLVVALGGNAISVPGEQGTIAEQFAQTQRSAQALCDAIGEGHQLVITHGNGPQVGSVLRRVEIASSELYPIPLEVCVADTQAGMGYMIAQCVMNELVDRKQPRHVATLVTSVVVDRNDPAFDSPSKPIGPTLVEADARSHEQHDGWSITRTGENKFRRIVPSPKPLEILELPTIRRSVEAGELVICCGGGGIPVYRDKAGHYHGAAAVIDKDLTSALLAQELDVSKLVLLTGVEHVCIDFGTPAERELKQLTIAEAKAYLAAGQFPAGSMGPKIEAAIFFLEQSRREDASVVIGDLLRLGEVLQGKSGTRMVRA